MSKQREKGRVPGGGAPATNERGRSAAKAATTSANPRWEFLRDVPLQKIRLDVGNPRFGATDDNANDENALILRLAREFDVLQIASSISSFTYFESEPVVLVRAGTRFVVLEGNRRICALKLLHDPSARKLLQGVPSLQERFEQLALDDPSASVPAVVVKGRKDANPLLGYRHISGTSSWQPWPQAVFIAKLVDGDGYSLERVAELTGEDIGHVSKRYRDFRILHDARDSGVKTDRAEKEFGIFSRALETRGIREFVGAPDPRKVRGTGLTEYFSSSRRLKDLLRFLYGDKSHPPALSDSRKLTDLGKILGVEEAYSELKRTNDLEAALDRTDAGEGAFTKALDRARRGLERARELAAHCSSVDDAVSQLDAIEQLASTLRDTISE